MYKHIPVQAQVSDQARMTVTFLETSICVLDSAPAACLWLNVTVMCLMDIHFDVGGLKDVVTFKKKKFVLLYIFIETATMS